MTSQVTSMKESIGTILHNLRSYEDGQVSRLHIKCDELQAAFEELLADRADLRIRLQNAYAANTVLMKDKNVLEEELETVKSDQVALRHQLDSFYIDTFAANIARTSLVGELDVAKRSLQNALTDITILTEDQVILEKELETTKIALSIQTGWNDKLVEDRDAFK